MTADEMTVMSDLVTFLRARLDEDEQVARAATPGPWRAGEPYPDAGSVGAPSGNVCNETSDGFVELVDARHIARHDPARVLAEVEAKRKIMQAHAPQHFGAGHVVCTVCEAPFIGERDDWPCDTLRFLALPYRGHEDYQDAWR